MYDEASDELSFNLATSYDEETNKSLFAYLNLEHEALVNLNSPILTCSDYITDQLAAIDLCNYDPNDQQSFDGILLAIESCVDASGHSIVPPVVYNSLDESLGNNIAKDENIKLILKSSDEEQVLPQSEDPADYEVEFEEIDGQWTASLSVSEDYLSSLGFSQSEVSELQQLLGELFLQSQVRFCQGEVSPDCFPEMLTFLQVLNINIQSIVQTGTTHAAMWDDKADQDIDHLVPHDYKWRPIVGGAIDGGVDAAASLPVLIYTAGDIMLDEEKQQGFINMFSREGMQQMIGGIFVGIDKTFSDQDKKEHAISKASVELALAYYVAAGKAAQGIKEALEKAGVLAKKLDKNPNLHYYLKKVVEDSPDPDLVKSLETVLETIESADLEKLLARLDKGQFDDFIKDLSGDASLARKFASEELSVDSWRLLDDAGYAALKKNPVSLEKLSNLLKNPKLADAGLDENMVSRLIKGNKNAGGAAAALDDLTKGLDDLVSSGTKFEDIGKLVTDLEKGGNFAEGAGWIQRHLTSNVDDFAGKTLIFESVEKVGESVRRVDVKMPDGNITKYFEFKSVGEIPPSNFATQFVKDMQISDVSDLGQLKWIFDGKKVPSLQNNIDDFIDALDNVEIPQSVIDKLIPGANKTKDALLDTIESRFDEIFQVK